MSTTAIAKLGVSLKLDNGNVVELREGDIVNDLVYRNNGVETTLSGSVRVIDANTRSNSTIPDDCPPEPYAHRFIQVPSLVIDSSSEYDAELNRVSIASILSIGSVTENAGVITVGVGGQYKALSEVLSTAEPGATIKLQDGEFTEALSFNKSVKIVGSANTVLSGDINVVGSANEEFVSVELGGIKLTGNALITVNKADKLSINNCIIDELTLPNTRTMLISVPSEESIDLQINNCVFNSQNNNSYHCIDVYGKLKNGSSISNNVFADASCTHNQISLYGVEDGATININNNECEMSANLIRFGMKGEPNCTINMIGNTYNATNEDEYAGLFLVQPYGTETTSFAKTIINVTKTTMSNPEGQLYYLYAGDSDTKFNDSNMPTVVVDGVVQTEHIVLPRTDKEIAGQ